MGTPPPPKPKYHPPQNEEFYGHEVSCRKNTEILGAHKIGADISGPRIADKHFTDTRILSESWQERYSEIFQIFSGAFVVQVRENPAKFLPNFAQESTVCIQGHCKEKRIYKGCLQNIGDSIKFKGLLVELLQNRRSLENQKPPENCPKKWTFLSLAFYNAPSLHAVKRIRCKKHKRGLPTSFCRARSDKLVPNDLCY